MLRWAASSSSCEPGPMARQPYDGVVVAAPVTVPYRRYSTNTAHWWVGRAVREVVQKAGLKSTDIDGLSLSSFTVGPDTAIGLTQHLGLSPRWLDHVPLGGASGVVALRRAARAGQCGGAEVVGLGAGGPHPVESLPPLPLALSACPRLGCSPPSSGTTPFPRIPSSIAAVGRSTSRSSTPWPASRRTMSISCRPTTTTR